MVLPGDVELFTAKPQSLAGLLANIHAHQTALPDFQRPWVWEPDMVRALLVSVAYRYPAGSLLTMPVSSAGFALRPFEGAGERIKTNPNLMVLDGQQRLTSLYQALYRRDGVRIKKRGRERVHHFYMDVGVLLSDPDEIEVGDPFFDQALFYVVDEKDNKRIRYEGLQPLYELTTRRHELEAGALPLNLIFDPDDALSKWREDYLTSRSEDQLARYKELSHDWDRLVQPWLSRIKNYPFPVVELQADMPLQAICYIFEKVNSTGVPLDVFDLCTAILWAQGFRLNERWAETRRALRAANRLRMQPIAGTAFLQGLALLDSLERKRAHPESRVAVACRKQDLMSLNANTVQQWWAPLVEGYEEASKFMTNEGIVAERILPYSTMLVPLATILADVRRRKGQIYAVAAYAKLRQWYWCSVFSQRYSSQVESNAALDVEQVTAWLDDGDEPDAVRTFGFRADLLQEIGSIRNAVYKGVLCLLVGDQARDFGVGPLLSIDLFEGTRQDHHHIFPSAALRRQGVDDPRADSIINKTLISATVNKSIGGRLPSKYIEKLSEQSHSRAKVEKSLRSHCIDPAVLAADNWPAFLHDRRERLRRLIAEACRSEVQPFSDGASPHMIDDVDEDDLL